MDNDAFPARVLTAAPEDNPGVQIDFPPDSRTQVLNTTEYPQHSIGQLAMTFPNGRTYTGTGTLLDDLHVLTAAHNLYSLEDGGTAVKVTFARARNGPNDPYGVYPARRPMMIPEEYKVRAPRSPWGGEVTDYTKYLYDFGLVTLAAPIHMQEFPVMGWVNGHALAGQDCSITGYPGDKPHGTMWTAAGPVHPDPSEDFLFYKISTFRGQGGSAVTDHHGQIIGIHIAGSSQFNSNFAVWLHPERIDLIKSWMG